MEDRYSVLIRLRNQLDADAFYCSFNGKKFRPSEVIYPLQMEYLDTSFVFIFVNFRLRYATYISLNRLSTLSQHKSLLRRLLVSLSYQLVQFVSVSYVFSRLC